MAFVASTPTIVTDQGDERFRMSRDPRQPETPSGGDDQRRVVYRTVHDWNGRETLSDTVVVAVAEAAGVDPIDLSTPLIESVDPDALDGLFRPRRDGSPREADGRAIFTTNGYEVEVHSDGQVLVYGPD